MKIVAKFNLFKECLSRPVDEGSYDVFYEDTDTMSVAEHLNLNNSKAPVNMIPAVSIGNIMAEMIMLGNRLATDGSYIYVTDNEQLLEMSSYSMGESSVFFVQDMESAIKKNEQENRPKIGTAARRKPRPKPKAKTETAAVTPAPAETVAETKPDEEPAKPEEPKTEKKEAVKENPKEEKAETKVTETVEDKAPESPKKKIRTTRAKEVKPEKEETPKAEEVPAEDKADEVPAIPEDDDKSTSQFKTPDSIVKELVAIDEEFGKYPDHIIAGIRDSDDVDDLAFAMGIYFDSKYVQDISEKIEPHYDKLKAMADRTKFTVSSVYIDGEFVL